MGETLLYSTFGECPADGLGCIAPTETVVALIPVCRYNREVDTDRLGEKCWTFPFRKYHWHSSHFHESLQTMDGWMDLPAPPF